MWSEDYLAFSSFESLYQAHGVARKGKSKKAEVVRYELNLADHLVNLERKLRSGKFDRFKYYSFYIYEPKVREVFATSYEGRIVLHSFCDNVLMPEIDKRLIYDNGACRQGKGTHFTQKRLRKHYSDYYRKYGHQGYVFKCNISKYFESIDHDILKQKLSVVFEGDILEFIEIIIDSIIQIQRKDYH